MSVETAVRVRTFLFTDIAGSTRLWETDPDAMRTDLETHFSILEGAVEKTGGTVFKTVGDAVYAVFDTARAAVEAAVAAQTALKTAEWQSAGGIAVRMGVATGEATERGGDYFGQVMNLCARIEALARTGQVLIAGSAASVIETHHTPESSWSLTDAGEHSLKGIERPQRVFVLTHDVLDQTPPQVSTAGSTPHNLPARLNRFVGRQTELRTVTGMLRDPEQRLLSVVGAGGVGKTRLVIETARQLLPTFSDGVFFLDLSELSDGGQLDENLYAVLGGSPIEHEDRPAALARILRDKSVLVVFDNFEHLLGEAALVSDLLESSSAHVLVTSREALGIRGETVYRLEPLSTAANLDDALELFLDRAKAVNAAFELTDANRPAVQTIVERVDGLPLALELVASRTELLSAERICEQLVRGTQSLKNRRRDVPQRQQTVTQAINWTYRSLASAEQKALHALAVIPGSFDIDAADTVLAAVLPNEDPLDLVQTLYHKSLLHRRDVVGQSRFRMLTVLRDFLATHPPEETVTGAAMDALCAWALEASAQFDYSKMKGLDEPPSLEWLAALYPAIRAALTHQIDHGPTVQTATIVNRLWAFWEARHMYAELDTFHEAVLHVPDLPPLLEGRLRMLKEAFLLVYGDKGNDPEPFAEYDKALPFMERAEDPRGVHGFYANRGVIALGLGDGETAEAMARKALEVSGDADIGLHRLMTTFNLAEGLVLNGKLEDAAHTLAEANRLLPKERPNPSHRVTLDRIEIRLSIARGELDKARETIIRMTREHDVTTFNEPFLFVLVCSQLASRASKHECAVRWVGAVRGQLEKQSRREPAEVDEGRTNVLALAREALGAATTDAGYEAGKTLDLPTVIAEIIAAFEEP